MNAIEREVGSMRGIVCQSPGAFDRLTLEEIPKPATPDDGVWLRVQAASLNPADFFQLTRVAQLARRLRRRSQKTPVVTGSDFAGTVEAVGGNVTEFQPGDEVFGGAPGAFAEYVVVRQEAAIVRKPARVSFDDAAALPIAAVTALQALRNHGRLQPGQEVLINGASGGVGTFAIQLAKCLGGVVTAVCSSRNVEQARGLGADSVIDYTKEDFTRADDRYDLMLDIAGNRSWAECRRVLRRDATFALVGGASHTVSGAGASIRHLLAVRLASMRASQRVVFFIASLKKPDLTLLAQLVESGQLKPCIDRRYRLERVVDAFGYMAEGHARGKILITI